MLEEHVLLLGEFPRFGVLSVELKLLIRQLLIVLFRLLVELILLLVVLFRLLVELFLLLVVLSFLPIVLSLLLVVLSLFFGQLSFVLLNLDRKVFYFLLKRKQLLLGFLAFLFGQTGRSFSFLFFVDRSVAQLQQLVILAKHKCIESKSYDDGRD